MGILGTERRPADKAFEHNRSDGPPVAGEGVALAAEDLGSDVIRSTDCGVRKGTTVRFTPSVDKAAVADGKIDLVKRDRVSVFGLV